MFSSCYHRHSLYHFFSHNLSSLIHKQNKTKNVPSFTSQLIPSSLLFSYILLIFIIILNTQVTTTPATPTSCYQLVLWLGNIRPGDRQLPPGRGSRCIAAAAEDIVIDTLYVEQRPYLCCSSDEKQCSQNICTFTCPLPPINFIPDVTVQEELYGWSGSFWSTSQHFNDTWRNNPSTIFTYYRSRNEELGIVKSGIILLLGVPVILGGISFVTGKLHDVAASTPNLSFYLHLLTTGTIAMILLYLFILSSASHSQESRNQKNSVVNDRAMLINVGLIYALMTVSYSPLILYTPKPRIQTIHINEKTLKRCCGQGRCLKYTKKIKTPCVRHFCAVIYLLGIALQSVSIYAIYNALREHLATDLETTVTIVVAYFILCLIYLVSVAYSDVFFLFLYR